MTDQTTVEVAENVVANHAAAEVAAQPAKATKKKRNKNDPERHSNPTFEREVKLTTTQAQRVYGRTMKYLAPAMFRLGVILHVIGDQQQSRQTEDDVRKAIAGVGRQLDEALAKSAEQIAAANIAMDLTYTFLVLETAKLQTPLAMQYLALIEKLDKLVQNIDLLWMNGLMDSAFRSNTNHEWQRMLLRLSNEIIEAQKRAYAAAVDKGKKDELDKRGVEIVDKAVSEAEDDDEDDLEEAENEAEAEAVSA